MGNYVHLCFRNNHPMEYVARQKGRIGDTLFLRVHSAVLEYDGVMFTNDVSNKNGVNAVSIQEAEKLIDFEVLYQKTNWKDPDIQERLQKVAKYEVLVPATIPLDLIGNLDG